MPPVCERPGVKEGKGRGCPFVGMGALDEMMRPPCTDRDIGSKGGPPASAASALALVAKTYDTLDSLIVLLCFLFVFASLRLRSRLVS